MRFKTATVSPKRELRKANPLTPLGVAEGADGPAPPRKTRHRPRETRGKQTPGIYTNRGRQRTRGGAWEPKERPRPTPDGPATGWDETSTLPRRKRLTDIRHKRTRRSPCRYRITGERATQTRHLTPTEHSCPRQEAHRRRHSPGAQLRRLEQPLIIHPF